MEVGVAMYGTRYKKSVGEGEIHRDTLLYDI